MKMTKKSSTAANRSIPYNLSPSDQIAQYTVSAQSIISLAKPTVATANKGTREQGNLKNAVYSHIRALRSLGRTSINTLEIATALSLPLKEVDRAVVALKSKGVKVI
jgi:hypothetical protein